MTTTESAPSSRDEEPSRHDDPVAGDVSDARTIEASTPFAVSEPSRTGFPPLRAYLKDTWARTPFIWAQSRADLKAQNYNTALGQFWLLLSPLLLAGVFILGRSVLRPMGTPAERNYLVAHLITGIFFYQWVASSLSTGTRSIVGNQRMILNTAFPRAVFPLASTLQGIFDFLPLLVVLFGVRALLGQPFGLSLIALPLLLVFFVFFNLGLTLGAATIMVYFRDFNNIVSLITRLWLWSTPILYTTEEIPDNIRPYLELNPLYPFYAMMEDIFAAQFPTLEDTLWAAGWTVFFFLAGSVIFLLKERDFAVRF